MKKYVKFLHYHWVAKHVVRQVGNDARQMDHCIFQLVMASSHSLKFTTIAYTTTIDQNLEWEEFAKFLYLIDITWVTQWHVIQVFINLTNFLCYLFDFRKDNGIPFVGPKNTSPIFWRLRPKLRS
jgi:hypothetical protein